MAENERREPLTAREALVSIALDEVDEVLTRTEQVGELIRTASTRFEAAAAVLNGAGATYRSEVERFTTDAKEAISRFIEGRTSNATAVAIETHRKTLQDAATLAFADQLTPALRDFARQVELLRTEQPRRTPSASRHWLWFFAGAGAATVAFGAAFLLWKTA